MNTLDVFIGEEKFILKMFSTGNKHVMQMTLDELFGSTNDGGFYLLKKVED